MQHRIAKVVPRKGRTLRKKEPVGCAGSSKKTPLPEPPIPAGCFFASRHQFSVALHRDFVQADILDRCPDNSQATGLRCEHVDLIGALPHEAPETLNGIGGLNVAMHRLRKGIKGQEVLFILNQASYRFWIALSVLGFEGGQFYQRLLLCGLLPDANEFSLDVATLSPGDRVEDVTLLMHQTALTRRARKQFLHRSQHPIMTIGDDKVDLGRSSCSQVPRIAQRGC